MTTIQPTYKSNNDVSLGIIIVSHNNQSTLKKLLATLNKQVSEVDFIVVIDNHIDHKSVSVAEQFSCVNKIIKTHNNGFAAGCNLGAKSLPKNITHILLLNPDTMPGKKSIEGFRSIANNWNASMGLLLLSEKKINSAGNAVHISGLSWCNEFNTPTALLKYPESIFIASGACMLIEKILWDNIGGMYEEYFLYYEDTDLSTRIILNGHNIGLEPSIHIYHDYDYKKSDLKWFYLERNRYIYILRCWPLTVIILLLPYLLCVEVGLWMVSILERRFVLKLRSTISFLNALPPTIVSRRDVQKNKVISSYEFLTVLESQVLTLQLGSPNKFKILNAFSKMYYLLVKNILKLTAKKVQ
jgi:GT2 family glycosyltransferase